MSFLRELDSLLRGERTTAERLRGEGAQISVVRMAATALVLGGAYGFFMGWFRASGDQPDRYQQLFASTVKLPLLFLLTLLVTFPSLYVFNCLVGVRLGFLATLRLLTATVVVNLAVAASLGPILAFFTLSTTNYPFMILLNVFLLGVSGGVALGFLFASLRKLADGQALGETPPAVNAAAREVTQDRMSIFYIWVIIYGAVGLQMGWLLRPFIGHPNAPFEWFRARQGNAIQGIINALERMLGV